MWNCKVCGEQIEDSFEVCWNCKTSKDGTPPEDYEPKELPKELANIREQLEKSSNADLERIANFDSDFGLDDLHPDAILLARSELARRKLPILPTDSESTLVGTGRSKRGNLPLKLLGVGIVIVIVGLGLITIFSRPPTLTGKWASGGGLTDGNPEGNWGNELWEFRPDNTCMMRDKMGNGISCKYTVLDNGSIRIEFKSGATTNGKIQNRKLIIDWGKEQSVLEKYR